MQEHGLTISQITLEGSGLFRQHAHNRRTSGTAPILIVVALMLTGCGAASGTTADSTKARDQPIVSGPLTGALEVFQERRGDDDVVPSAAADALNSVLDGAEQAAADARPGRPVMNESRLLLRGVGIKQRSLYAVPTETGDVCLILTEGGGVGCASAKSFNAEDPVSWGQTDPDVVGEGEPIFVHGLILDDVVRVDVIDNTGELHGAFVRNNAFFFQYDRPDRWTRAVILTYRDGSSQEVALPGEPPPGLE